MLPVWVRVLGIQVIGFQEFQMGDLTRMLSGFEIPAIHQVVFWRMWLWQGRLVFVMM